MDDILRPKKKFSAKGFEWTEKKINSKKLEYILSNYNLNFYLAKSLASRDVEINSVNNFLFPKIKNNLPNPSILYGLDDATTQIVEIINSKKKIGLIGDFDVDGITSTAIFCRFLKKLGTPFKYYIPDRIKDGYGPNLKAIYELHNQFNCDLIITLDCGISSLKEINKAREKGIPIIVVDHHKQLDKLPNATAIINPNQHIDDSNLSNLCAVGVTFMLLISIRRKLLEKKYFKNEDILNLVEVLDLVALGTVCDLVKQDIYNRSILSTGLKVINKTKNIGIEALIKVSGLKEHIINEYHLGFVLGPRINAGGRLRSGSIGVELLLSESKSKTFSIAEKLNELNIKRKKIEKFVELEAINLVDASSKIVCVSKTNWHQGVIGIVASRLVEKFSKPVVVISEDELICKGSCRSFGNIDIGEIIKKARLEKIIKDGGGHKMAAGFSIEKQKINEFKIFLSSFEFTIEKKCKLYDYEIKLSNINEKLYEEIKKLGPFGLGNTKPVILIKNCFLKFPKVVGDNHVNFLLSDIYGNTVKAIAFKAMESDLGKHLIDKKGKQMDVFCYLDENVWKGEKTIQLIVIDIYA